MGKQFMSDSPIDEILRKKRQHTQSVEVLVDPEIAAEIKNLERQEIIEMRKDQKENRNPLAPGIRKKIEELEKESEEYVVTFVFKDIGRKRFEDLWRSCPPTDEQKELGYQWNPDEFSPLIMAETCIKAGSSDGLTLEQAQSLYDEWSTAEAEMLAMTAINANMGVSSIPLSKTATGGTSDTDLSLITAPAEESPTATS